MTPSSQAHWASEASEAANDSVKAAGLSKKFAGEAARDRERVEELTPDPHGDAIRALATREQSALLRVGPRRNRWRDLESFEARLGEIERRRAQLVEEIGALNGELAAEPNHHTAQLADWLAAGEAGERPTSRAAELERRIADLQAEHEALGIRYDTTLREQAEHVAKNRRRMWADVRKEADEAAGVCLRLVDELEHARRKLLDLRATEVWVNVYPHESLTSQPNTQSLVGAVKRVQEPLLPGVQAGLAADSLFSLLRADVDFCRAVATVDQAAAERDDAGQADRARGPVGGREEDRPDRPALRRCLGRERGGEGSERAGEELRRAAAQTA